MSSAVLSSLKNTFFGEVPQIVLENLKYLPYDEEFSEFHCTHCDKYIQKDSPRTLEAHINSLCHKEIYCPESKVTHHLSGLFPKKIPQIVKNNIHVLDVKEEGYECVLCKKIIQVSQNEDTSLRNFSYHLTSHGHKSKLKEYNNRLDELKDVYSEIPEVVKNNVEYMRLTNSRKNYVCELCNVILKVYEDPEKTENMLIDHFESYCHIWETKRIKVLSLIPDLQDSVHTYLIRNIDYFLKNGAHLYCSLCHENIICNPSYPAETEENLKYHCLSSDHVNNVFSRQTEDARLKNLIEINGDFTDKVLMNLRYVELNEGIFRCIACNEEFYADSEIFDMLNHLESNLHYSNVYEEEKRCENVIDSLKNELNEMPNSIEENLDHIEFVQGNDFNCTLCDVTVPWMNLESHLCGKRHTEAYEDDDSSVDSLQEHFEDVFGEDYVEEMPHCINDNRDHIEYHGDSNCFYCKLCQEFIIIDQGTRMEEITWQNLVRHFLSKEHTSSLKHNANMKSETYERLKAIFCTIPRCVLNNVQFLSEQDEYSFYCEKCCVEIQLGTTARTSAQNFLQHLRGKLHKSNIEAIETSIDNAYRYIDEELGVPESLLRDVDFWNNSLEEPDLYCDLCQLDLSVDLDDLLLTRRNLECHIKSDQHMTNLKDL